MCLPISLKFEGYEQSNNVSVSNPYVSSLFTDIGIKVPAPSITTATASSKPLL